MNEVYQRISENKPFDINLKPYKEEQVREVLEYFEGREDYEKCQVISNFLNKRFNHTTNFLK